MIIKKRVCISILLTVLVVVLTNTLWLPRKPLDIQLYAAGDKIKQIEVQLSKEEAPDFKKYKSKTSSEDITTGTDLNFKFKKPRNPKWIKIVATTDSTGGGGDPNSRQDKP